MFQQNTFAFIKSVESMPHLFKPSFRQFKKYFHTKNLLMYPQPTSKSHPHLLKNNEITPGLTPDVYNNRRNKLFRMIEENFSSSRRNTAHLVLVPSAAVVYMSENIPYPFRQLTDFYYFCGYKEPNSMLALTSVLGTENNQAVLFIPKPSATSERWEGVKMSLKDTTHFLGINQTLYVEEFENFLQSYAKSNEKFTVWYDFSNSGSRTVHQTVHSFIEVYRNYLSLESPRHLLHKCRLIKCNLESKLIKKTCRIGAEAMTEVIKISKPLVLECHLQAKMEYECRVRGGDCLAFPPVIAGGSRANTIHYIDNNNVINDNELVLMDAGCEYNGYCSDLSRTWPVNGKYTDPQRELYDLILSIQEHLIELCVEKPSLDFLFKIMCNNLGKGLQKLGIIPTNLNDEHLAKVAFNFCPHHVSHYLGMDVHDTNAISRGIKLLPGMVVTVEPGIYISKTDMSVPEKYRGICIRIEDDILITENGVEILTSACPKDAEDIQKLIQSQTTNNV